MQCLAFMELFGVSWQKMIGFEVHDISGQQVVSCVNEHQPVDDSGQKLLVNTNCESLFGAYFQTFIPMVVSRWSELVCLQVK